MPGGLNRQGFLVVGFRDAEQRANLLLISRKRGERAAFALAASLGFVRLDDDRRGFDEGRQLSQIRFAEIPSPGFGGRGQLAGGQAIGNHLVELAVANFGRQRCELALQRGMLALQCGQGGKVMAPLLLVVPPVTLRKFMPMMLGLKKSSVREKFLQCLCLTIDFDGSC